MELGKLQKQWIADLRKYPERQVMGALGKQIPNGEIKACCLGQFLLTVRLMNDPDYIIPEEGICDYVPHDPTYYSNTYLPYSYKRLGLISGSGSFKENVLFKNEIFTSLAAMNDDQTVFWFEIADYIEANPENVFTKSV